MIERLVGRWRSRGRTVDGVSIAGTDVYEWFDGGKFLIHHVDVVMGSASVRVLEMIGPFDGRDSWPMRAFDNGGGYAEMTLRPSGDGGLVLDGDETRSFLTFGAVDAAAGDAARAATPHADTAAAATPNADTAGAVTDSAANAAAGDASAEAERADAEGVVVSDHADTSGAAATDHADTAVAAERASGTGVADRVADAGAHAGGAARMAARWERLVDGRWEHWMDMEFTRDGAD